MAYRNICAQSTIHCHLRCQYFSRFSQLSTRTATSLPILNCHFSKRNLSNYYPSHSSAYCHYRTMTTDTTSSGSMNSPTPSSNLITSTIPTTTSSTTSLAALIAVLVDASERAGHLIRSILESGNLETVSKSAEEFDPQTLADVSSQDVIVGMLHAFNNEIAIVGEEDDNVRHDIDRELKSKVQSLIEKEVRYSITLQNDMKWSEELLNLPTNELAIFIDPLDGTREFALGMVDAVTVLCGVTRNGKPIAGVIHCPLTATTVWGAVDVGVFGLEELRHRPSIVTETDRAIHSVDDEDLELIAQSHKDNQSSHKGGIIVTTRSHFSVQMRNVLHGMDPKCILRSGGAGSKVLLILSGRADAYVYPSQGTKSWDTCACEAILIALGGRMSDSYGQPLIYDTNGSHQNDRGVLATLNNHDHYVLSPHDPLPRDFD